MSSLLSNTTEIAPGTDHLILIDVPLKKPCKTISLIFPEDRITDVVKLKPLSLLEIWENQNLVVTIKFSNVYPTYHVGLYNLSIDEEFLAQNRVKLVIKINSNPLLKGLPIRVILNE